MIAWKYLNKTAATVEAMRDYATMEFIIRIYEPGKAELRDKMTSVRASAPTGMPRGHNPKAGETWLVAQISNLDVLEERYHSALEYMSWYKPAWDALSEDERYILTEFFLRDGVSKTDAINSIGEKFFIERAQAYRRKDKAIDHLTLLLYGK